MQCNNCGKDLLPGAEYCGNCGAKIISSNSQPPAMPAQEPQVSQSPIQPANTVPEAQPSPPASTPATTLSPAEPVGQSAAAVATQGTPPPAAQPAPMASSPQQPAQPTTFAVQKQESNGLSIASMVLGILALLSSLLWFVAGPLAILAIVFGFIGKGKGGKSMAMVGIITSGIAIVISVLFLIWALNNVDKLDSQSGSRYNTSLILDIF